MHPIETILKEIKLTGEKNSFPISYIRIQMKEYLQDIILHILYNNQNTKSLIFYGGTCLRKIYKLNRLSEDLDFENPKNITLEQIKSEIDTYFKGISFDKYTIKIQKGDFINRLTIKFEILHDLGLSEYLNEKLYIKVEVNNNLTGEYSPVMSPYFANQFSMLISHYDIETLFAGKIIACLERDYTKGNSNTKIKGRDFYDLIWYMSKNIVPNESKLLDSKKNYSLKKVFKLLDVKIETISINDLRIDLLPLFEDFNYINTWCENFHKMYSELRKRY